MKRKIIGGLLLACACTFTVGAAQLSSAPASAAGITHDGNDLVTMGSGASVRVKDENTSGIRFAAKINAIDYEALEDTYGEENVTAGMIIVPSDYLGATKATAFTHEALQAYLNTLPEERRGYAWVEDSRFKSVDDGANYQFAFSLTNIFWYNYARDFVATAYVKVTTSADIEGFTANTDDTAQYNYADFNQDADARNIFDVASQAYNDRRATQEGDYKTEVEYNGTTSYSKLSTAGLTAAKTYMDKIADVENVGGEIDIANNTAYYASPYAIIGSGNSYAIESRGENPVEPIDIIYNGMLMENMYVIDNGTQLATVRSGLATYDGFEVSLKNPFPANTNPSVANFTGTPSGYVAFEGDYGVGTFIDVTFKGNNMPIITFFANEINGNLCGNQIQEEKDVPAVMENTGLMLLNGMITGDVGSVDGSGALIHNKTNIFVIYKDMYRINANLDGKTAATGELANFTQDALGADPDKQYRVTAGTVIINADEVAVYLALYDATTDELIAQTVEKTGLTKESIATKLNGANANIILFGAAKGQNTTTEFTYSAPYTPTEVPTILSGKYPESMNSGALNTAGVIDYKVIGKNTVNTYADFYFTGKNIPNIMMYANEADGMITTSGTARAGIVVINGVYSNTNEAAHRYPSTMKVFGPYRIGSCWGYDATTVPNGYRYQQTASPFAYDNLDESVNYKYTIGSFVEGEKVFVDMGLYNAETGACIARQQVDTGFTVDELKTALGTEGEAQPEGYFIAVGGMNSENTKTVFTHSEPYQSTNVIRVSGVTFNSENNVTVKGTYPANSNPNSLYTTGQHSNYIGWKGDYGVGTYVDFTFTGKNMPNVMLFADTINGNITDRTSGTDTNVYTGYLLLNQMKCSTSGGAHNYDYFVVWGPNRLIANGDSIISGIANSKSGYDEAITNLDKFQLNALDDSHTYKYTVGTKVVEDIVVIELTLQDLTAEAESGEGTATVTVDVSTGKTAAELATALKLTSETPTGNIVAYAAFKGSTSEHTTFTYTAPYTK